MQTCDHRNLNFVQLKKRENLSSVSFFILNAFTFVHWSLKNQSLILILVALFYVKAYFDIPVFNFRSEVENKFKKLEESLVKWKLIRIETQVQV